MRTNPDNLKAILSDPGTATLGMMTAKRKGYLDACHDALLAHELLAALEAAVLSEQLDKHHDLMARAAIAKAKGSEP